MRCWIYIAVIYIGMSVAHAAETPHNTESITLDETIVRVLENSPVLKAGDLDARAAATRIRHARLTSPFKAKLELENFGGSGAYNKDDLLETTLSLAKVLELGDKPALRGESAQQEANLLRNEQDARRLDLLAETARRFLHVVIDQKRLSIAKDKLSLVKHTYQIVDHRVKAGRSPVAERRRVSIALARAEIELEHANHELSTSRLKLATMWGDTTPAYSSAQAALFDLQQVEAFEQLEILLGRNPDLIRFATARRLAEARLRLAQARRRSDIEVSGGVRYFSGPDDGAFVLSASIPLGSGPRAAPLVEEKQILAQRGPLHYQQRRLDLYASLYEIYQELSHAYTATDTLRKLIIPEAERALLDYESGYSAGRYSLLELTEVQRTLLDARLEAVMTAAGYHRFRIEIERLTGAAMPTGVAQ